MAEKAAWRSITVVVDPQARNHPALKKAALLAERAGARLTLLNTFVLPQPMADVARISARELINAALRDRRRLLDKLAGPLRRRGLKVDCVVEWDHPQSEAIVRHVFATRPDLLVAETTRHGPLARWILSNTDWELIRTCPCPLWLVRGQRLPARPKLLVAVDPGHGQAGPTRLDARLMDAARALTGVLGGTVAIGHADDRRA
ncbi:MAG: universal stress protein, partial [Gammaproteobacteria bacterium]|nr:universal stress protein [Gammaproteobacteria bacterium]